MAFETSERWLLQRSIASRVRLIWLAAPTRNFERLGRLDRRGQVDGGVEDAGGVAGLDRAGRGFGKDAGQAGGLKWRGAGQDVHGRGVGAERRGINPGDLLFDGIVVDQVAGLEVVGAVEDEVCAAQQFVDIAGNQVGDAGIGPGPSC